MVSGNAGELRYQNTLPFPWRLFAGYETLSTWPTRGPLTVVNRSAGALKTGAERVMIRPYPPAILTAVA